MTFQSRGFEFLKDIEVRVSVELGRTEMKLRDAMALAEDSVVTLDRLTDELLDVMVNGKPIARGEVVALGDKFGIRIVEMADGESAPSPDSAGTGFVEPQVPGADAGHGQEAA